jgi:pyridine nucleotide-disulfide oxidoreductase family protein
VLEAARDWHDAAEVTLVSPDALTAYSGMVPGVIAGHYQARECLIDIERLAKRSGVRFIRTAALGLDPVQKTIRLGDGTVLPYDIASIDVGATPHVTPALADAIERGHCGEMAIAPCKPFPMLMDRLDHFLGDHDARPRPVELCVVGAGLAGIEVALALAFRMRAHVDARVRLLCGDARLMPSAPLPVGAALEQACIDHGVELVRSTRITAVEPGALMAADGRRIRADLALLATGASAPAWLADSGLALDPQGFIAVAPTLASVSHPSVFAAGDCASMLQHPRPKAGVYAVRQGPPLAANLQLALAGDAPTPFTPQREALALAALGPRSAVAIRNGLILGGPASRGYLGRALSAALARRLWRWKDRIDRAFVERFSCR